MTEIDAPSLGPCCPSCRSPNVQFKTKADQWECEECEQRFPAPATSRALASPLSGSAAEPRQIFFSYPHDNNEELVRLFKQSLEQRGHSVWYDTEQIKPGDDWRGSITKGIETSQIAIAFLSKHGLRDPGVCRNEIAMALNGLGTLYPVLLEPVSEVTPPVTIAHLQWQDLSQWRAIREGGVAGKDWQRWYEDRLIEIIHLVEGKANEFENDIRPLREVLKPISFASDIAFHVPDFVGREWVFEAYEQWQDQQPKSRLFWIKAGPGVGKTALAALLAHSHQSAIVGAWFCQASSLERRDPHKALCTLAYQLAVRLPDFRARLRARLGITASGDATEWRELRNDLAKKNVADLFHHLLKEPLSGLIWREHKLVLVIDALDEATDAEGANPITDVIATHLHSLPDWLGLVVTSRPEASVVSRLQGFNPFEMDAEDPRNQQDLKHYLRLQFDKRAALAQLQANEQERVMQVLLDKCEGTVLYLQQALQEWDAGSITDLTQTPRGLRSLYRIAFSYRFKREEYETHIKPLLRLVLVAPGPLPTDLARNILSDDAEAWQRRRDRLGAYLIETPAGLRVFHKTLGEWLVDPAAGPYLIDPAVGAKDIGVALWNAFAASPDPVDLAWPMQTQAWLPDMVESLPQWSDAQAVSRYGLYLLDRYALVHGEKVLRRCLAIREASLGPAHPDTASALNDLASLLKARGNYVAAEPMFRRALAIDEAVCGPSHPDTATGLNNLGQLLMMQGNHAEAEHMFRRSLEISETVRGLSHDTAAVVSNLAALRQAQGKYAEAEPLFRRALSILEAVCDQSHPDTATGLSNLANSLQAQGNYAEAEPLLRRSLGIKEAVLGPGHPGTAIAFNNLAGMFHEQGKYAEAEPLFRRSLEIKEAVLGPRHPSTAVGLMNLAELLREKGNYAEAESLLRRSLGILDATLGPNHPTIASALKSLASSLVAQGSHAEAESLFRRLRAIQEAVSDSNYS